MTAPVRRRLVLAAAALALGGAAALPQPAQARPAPAPASATTPQAARAGHSYLRFTKGSDPQNSRLSFVVAQTDGSGHTTSRTVGRWRAGSGNGSKDSCAPFAGWLPDGTYPVKAFYEHHDGGPHGVNGIAWYIGDHRCPSGRMRTDLFIHSEMLPSGAAGSSEPYRWDGDSDYRSNGCIKLKPSDIRALRAMQAAYPAPHTLYVS